jgi:ABC-type sugar transport system ATPase subunit
MDHGRIEQVGTPQEIYDAPKNIFVAWFLNISIEAPPISLIDGRWMPQGEPLSQATVGVRPEEVEVSGECRADRLPGFEVTTRTRPRGDELTDARHLRANFCGARRTRSLVR